MPSRRQKPTVNYSLHDPEAGPPPITFSDEDDFKPDADDDADMDLDLDDVVSEHSSPEPQDIMEDIEPELPKKKRGRPKVKVESTQTASRAPKATPQATAQATPPTPMLGVWGPVTAPKARIINESFGERFRMILGEDEKVLIDAIETRIQWGNVGFVPEESIINQPLKFGKSFKPEQAEPFEALSKLEKTSEEVEVEGFAAIFNDKELVPGSAIKTDNVTVLNTGSFCKDVRWAPFVEGNLQYLAVTVVANTVHPIDASAADITLGVFQKPESDSLVYFYQFDVETQTLEPYALLDCGKRGPVQSFCWRPCSGQHEFALVFQSGELAVAPLPSSKGSFDLVPQWLPRISNASCVTWADPASLLCGTKDGFIAHLDTQFRVKFFHQVHLSIVASIAASYPSPSAMQTMCSTSLDGDTKVTDLQDLSEYVSISRNKTFIASVAFQPMLNSYATQDDHILTRLVWAHTPQNAGGTQLTKHDSAVNAVGAGSYYHPFTLSGSTDGSLVLVNAIRRAFVPKRNLKTEKDICLWKFECEEQTRRYRFHEKLVVGDYLAKMKAPETLRMSPQTCAITSLDWLQAKHAAGWYAAATASGLVRIEKLN